MTAKTIKIDIVSDVVCPWCIIGYRRLEAALEQVQGSLTPEITWHPFELNPKMPQGGQHLREHLAEKYGTTLPQSKAVRQQITDIGKELGFTFSFSDEMRIYNTFKAHQLLHWAKEYDKQHDLKMFLFSSYFTDGQAIDQQETLINAVESVGLNPREAIQILEEGTYVDEVRTDLKKWLNKGIYAVPAFIINDEFLVSGAQRTGSFLKIFEKLQDT